MRYTPVLKFVPSDHGYVVRRMTYRGDGGWSSQLDYGPLAKFVVRYVPRVGTAGPARPARQDRTAAPPGQGDWLPCS